MSQTKTCLFVSMFAVFKLKRGKHVFRCVQCIMYFLLQMLTINLEESDCFAAWISVTDVPGLEPKVVDGKGVY